MDPAPVYAYHSPSSSAPAPLPPGPPPPAPAGPFSSSSSPSSPSSSASYAAAFDLESGVTNVYWTTCICFPVCTCCIGLLCVPCVVQSQLAALVRQKCVVDARQLTVRTPKHENEITVALADVVDVVHKSEHNGGTFKHTVVIATKLPGDAKSIQLSWVKDPEALKTQILDRRAQALAASGHMVEPTAPMTTQPTTTQTTAQGQGQYPGQYPGQQQYMPQPQPQPLWTELAMSAPVAAPVAQQPQADDPSAMMRELRALAADNRALRESVARMEKQLEATTSSGAM